MFKYKLRCGCLQKTIKRDLRCVQNALWKMTFENQLGDRYADSSCRQFQSREAEFFAWVEVKASRRRLAVRICCVSNKNNDIISSRFKCLLCKKNSGIEVVVNAR